MFTVPAAAKSWIDVEPNSPFPIQNLPLGRIVVPVGDEEVMYAPVTIVGRTLIALEPLVEEGLLSDFEWPPTPAEFRLLREELFELLRADGETLRDNQALREIVLIDEDEAVLANPIDVTSFVDFYSGIHHASNVGKMFRPDMPPLLPNYRHIPIAYHGRAETVSPTGLPVRRPKGVQKIGEELVYEPTRELDFELELGVVLGEASADPLTPAEAMDLALGVVIVNDWSARDVQRFEYQPLGPFLAKSFNTGMGPWLVSLDALAPFRREGMPQEPEPLPHLQDKGLRAYDIELEVWLQTARMTQPQKISHSNAQHLYWSFAQQIAHLSSNGNWLAAGDLVGTGTISADSPEGYGSLLELTWRGTQPLVMTETGETRTFLEDGDTLIMTGYAQGDGYRIGLGSHRATIEPSDG